MREDRSSRERPGPRGGARRFMGMGALVALSLLGLTLALTTCHGPHPTPRRAPADAPKASQAEAPKARPAPAPTPTPDDEPGAPPTDYPAPARLLAIGDVHGDLPAFKRALSYAGLLGEGDRWVGGQAVLVQTGDVLDRGGDEPEILDLIEALEAEAAAAGGRVIALNGNHETMNAQGDLRYVTPEGFADFASVEGPLPSEALARLPAEARGRLVAFAPGGPFALRLAQHNVAVKVGDTVFAHGGVTPSAARYGLRRLNRQTRAWLRGEGPLPEPVNDPAGPLWSRHFSDEPDAGDCALLREALALLGAKRMVVGHTVMEGGIAPACGGAVLRIDVGLSAAYGGAAEALEIVGDTVRALGVDGPRDLETPP